MNSNFPGFHRLLRKTGGRVRALVRMNRVFAAASLASFASLVYTLPSSAQEYNRVPASDNAQYSQCISYTNSNYEGGSSPISGTSEPTAASVAIIRDYHEIL